MLDSVTQPTTVTQPTVPPTAPPVTPVNSSSGQLAINVPIYLRSSPYLGATEEMLIEPGTTVTWLCKNAIGGTDSSGNERWERVLHSGDTGYLPSKNGNGQEVDTVVAYTAIPADC
jgi:L-ascorbate metabolism protein UlaG (beta-lactamase superfamily)